MIRLVKDFLWFRELMKVAELTELDPMSLSKLKGENAELEKKINTHLLNGLALTMVRERIPHEYAAGFRQALMLRSNLKKLKSE